jgi:hypothetical protein
VPTEERDEHCHRLYVFAITARVQTKERKENCHRFQIIDLKTIDEQSQAHRTPYYKAIRTVSCVGLETLTVALKASVSPPNVAG